MTNKEQLSSTSKAIHGLSSQTLVTILLGLVEIISFSIMSRLLTQQDFGYYAAISAITVVFSSFSETGIGAAIIQRKEIDSKYINNSFTLSFLFGIFISLLLVIMAAPLSTAVADESMKIPLMLMSITLLCNCLVSVNTSIMYRRLEFFRVGMINLVALVITTIIAILLALKGFGYYAIITKAVLTSIITLLLSWVMAKTRYSFELDINTFKAIFGFSGWLMASVFFRNLAQQLDRLLMSRLLSVTSLGAYNRPKDFINQVSSKVGGIFDTALFPVLSQIQDDLQKLKNAYLRSLFLMNLASTVFAVALVFNGELIIRIFFGAEWFSVLPVFQILSVAVVFYFDARLADCYLRSLGWTKQQFIFRILEVVTKVVGLLFGFRFGIIGVAVVVLITDAFMVAVKHAYISKKLGISFQEGLSTFGGSIRVLLIEVPLMIIVFIIIPRTLSGEIVLLLLFTLISFTVFFLLPSMVGKIYKYHYYPRLVSSLFSIIKFNRND